MWTCKKCYSENPDSVDACQGCGEKRAKSFVSSQAPQPRQVGDEPRPKRRMNAANYDGKPGLSTWLDVFGWILLFGGILTAIVCFSTMSYVENQVASRLYAKAEKMFSFTGFMTSVGVLFSSIFGFLCVRGLSQLVWDSSTTKALAMQMYNKTMNDD